MSFSPFARFRNFNVDNLKALLEVYPDQAAHFSWSEAGDLIESVSSGYKRTSYQQACQFGLENRENDSFCVQSYLYSFNDDNLRKYIEFWIKTYFAPNPYVRSNDNPILIFCELAKEILDSPNLKINYFDFFNRRIGGKSEDILMNAIKEYCYPLKYEKKDGIHYFYIDGQNKVDLERQVSFIESEFAIPDPKSRKAFFDRYNFSNFCKFHGISVSVSNETDVSRDNKTEERLTGGSNILLYGVPGSGKSHTIDSIVENSEYERVVFHPDYTYSDFVGQIMPRLKGNADGTEKLTYEFVPGPFTKALKAAVDKEDSMHYLVIEEINRGNAPAIFGDVFQLLDRNEDGSGKYHITNFDIAREVYGDEAAEIRIPSNLSILATMNTSDQNVFTLDTAFQRRWNMKYIENNVAEAEHANEKIEYSDVTWGGFASTVNEEILQYNAELSSSEDKQLGAYFVTRAELTSDKFPEKALKYLWDDAFKLEREKIFRPEIKSVGDLVHSYDVEIQNDRDPIKGVMRAEVYRKMMDMSASGPEEAIDDSEIFEAEINDGE